MEILSFGFGVVESAIHPGDPLGEDILIDIVCLRVANDDKKAEKANTAHLD